MPSDRLIHAYFDIDYDIVWEAITNEIPGIIPELERLIYVEQRDSSEHLDS